MDVGVQVEAVEVRLAGAGRGDRSRDNPGKLTERLYIRRSPSRCPDVPGSRGILAYLVSGTSTSRGCVIDRIEGIGDREQCEK